MPGLSLGVGGRREGGRRGSSKKGKERHMEREARRGVGVVCTTIT